jgi:hypothetical protein
VELELRPDQPEPVAAAIEVLVEPPRPAPDPWWQAGLEDTLET